MVLITRVFVHFFYEWIMSELKPGDWLTERLGFHRTQVKNHQLI